MTVEEARVVAVAASVKLPHVRLQFARGENGFIYMKARPCPLHVVGVDGESSCGIYSSRPYNCRRFACMRPDPKTEPWEEDENGCRNVLERLATSRVARRAAQLIQRRAQKWALKNGWGQNT